MRRSTILQVLALITMTVDHVGSIFFPDLIFMRIMGRMALPVFCYGIAEGFYQTRDKQKYFIRLLTVAIISEIPHILALGNGGLNICFSLLSGFMLLFCLEKKEYVWGSIFFVLNLLMGVEYGLLPVTLILMFAVTRQSKHLQMILCSVLMLIYTVSTGYYLQVYAILFMPFIIYFPELKERLPFPRRAFYIYYPAHLMVLFFMRLLVAV